MGRNVLVFGCIRLWTSDFCSNESQFWATALQLQRLRGSAKPGSLPPLTSSEENEHASDARGLLKNFAETNNSNLDSLASLQLEPLESHDGLDPLHSNSKDVSTET